MHGTKVANWAMDEADLIVAIGARFDDRVTGAVDEFARDAKIVHIDVDPSEIGKIVTAHVPVVGDAKLALRRAVRRLRASSTPTRRGSPSGGSRIRGWQAAHPLREPEPAEPGCVAPEFALDQLARRARRRDRDHRRRPAPDVGRRPARLRGAAALDHERRARHDGLRPAVRARRPGRVARTAPSCACPARARS